MKWVWQQKNWPNFEFDATLISKYEFEFAHNIGKLNGIVQHVIMDDVQKVQVNILTQEALATSSIEGEILKRESVQSSIRKHLGLKTTAIKVEANEAGVAELMVNVYQNFNQKLNSKLLFEWHKMIANGRRDLDYIGSYRRHAEPMQIVAGVLNYHQVFYEAPPSSQVNNEMKTFINWYNANLNSKSNLSILAFAGIAHLYFEMIHPFEDGNGRIGRALVEKAISQRIGQPALNSFATIIESKKRKYYDALKSCNTDLDITKWLIYFSETIIASQIYSIKLVQFLITKAHFFTKFSSHINSRQEKVLLRIFEEGIDGFKGGLSAANYKSITNASTATVTRDLAELVNMQALIKKGVFKNSRYYLNDTITAAL
jgi:Fic family protein